MQVVFKTNLGTADARKFGLDLKKCQKAMTLDVSSDIGEALKAAKLAVSPEDAKKDELIQSALGVSKEDFDKGDLTVKAVAAAPAITGVSDDSPVHQSNIADAIATIENMRSKDKLQHVIDNDPRAPVKEAAKKRLAAL